MIRLSLVLSMMKALDRAQPIEGMLAAQEGDIDLDQTRLLTWAPCCCTY